MPKDIQEEQLLTFNSIEDRVFSEKKGKIYIGKEEIKADIKELLKDQAKWLQTSQLYEILRATIINESYNAALIQSTDFDQVKFAKALYHWQFVLDNMLLRLTSK